MILPVLIQFIPPGEIMMSNDGPIPDEIIIRRTIAERLRELALLRAILRAIEKYRRQRTGGDQR
jgi:hypothetical protein